MANRVISYVFRGNFSNLSAGLTAAGRSVQATTTRLNALNAQGARMRASFDAVGGAAGKLGLVAAAGVGAAVLTAAKFDKAMSAVQAATHESTQNMDLLRQAALKAGAETVYSATEAAGAIEELSKAGVSTRDILGGGLNGALSLAAAGAMDVGEAAETAASALTMFKLSGSDVPHVADLLAAGAGKAQGSVHDLGMAMNQAGLVASQTGLSIEETVGTLSAFASAGLIGSDAGTSFKTMLQSLTPSSDEAARVMKTLGISAYDAQGNFVGMAKFADILRQGLSGLSVEQQNAALKTIFGSDAVRAASLVYQQGASGIQGWIDKTNDAGYAAETAAQRLDNLSGDWEKFTGSLETALIGAGDGSEGPLRKLVQGATSVVDAFNDLSPAAQSATTGVLGVTALLGGGVWAASAAISGIANLRTNLQTLGVSAGTVTGALKAVAAAGAALTVGVIATDLVDSWDDAAVSAKQMQVALGDLAQGEVDKYLRDLTMGADSLGDALRDAAYNDFNMLGLGAADEIEKLDEALANLATQDPEAAARAFATIKREGKDAGVAIDDLKAKFPEYAAALSLAEQAAAENADVTREGSDAFKAHQQAVEADAEALKESRDAANDTAREFFNLGDSLDDSKVSLGEWIQQMNDQAVALRDFRRNAETAANRGLRQGLIAALEEAGPAGAMRMKQLANATDSEIRKANAAWSRGQQQIGRYTDAVGGVPKTAGTAVTVNGVTAAVSSLSHVSAQITALDGRRAKTYVDNYITTIRQFKNAPQGGATFSQHAAGGFITGPGTATSDSIPAYLSNGEYVIKAAAVAKYGVSMFDRLNTMRFAEGGLVPGYATGGRVFASSGVGNLTDRQLRALSSAAAQRALDRLATASEKAKSALERETQARDSLRSSISQGLTRDLWTSGAGNAFSKDAAGGSFAGVMGQLRGQRADSQAFARAVATLKKKGVDGAALSEIIQSGDLDRAKMMAGRSKKDLRSYESLYNSANRARDQAALRGANAVHGGDIGSLRQELRGVRHDIQALKKANDRHHAAAQGTRKAAPREQAKNLNKAASSAKRSVR